MLSTPDGITYRAIIIEDSIYISPESKKRLDDFRKAGVPILTEGSGITRQIEINGQDIVSCHRVINGKDAFFLANISGNDVTASVRLASCKSGIEIMHLDSGKKERIRKSPDGMFSLRFSKGESVMIFY